MKFVSFLRAGRTGFGVCANEGIVDLTGKLHPDIVSIRTMLAAGMMPAMAAYVEGRHADFAFGDVTHLPVIPDPQKILCAGLNYAKHKAETGRPDVAYPTIFTRYADTQVGHLQPIIKPASSDRLDYEGEVAVIIGIGGRNIPEKRALNHVAGYACYNDATMRDWQRHTFQFTPGKNFPSTGAFGPSMVTAEAVGDYTKLSVQTRLNGKVMQDAGLADLLFPVETLIAYVSSFTPLSPGDVILSGTPGGVGDKREPPVYMVPGDVVEVEAGMLGTLINPICAEPAL